MQCALTVLPDCVTQNVPMFKLFKGGIEVESFATRDRQRIAAAINKHTEHELVEQEAAEVH